MVAPLAVARYSPRGGRRTQVPASPQLSNGNIPEADPAPGRPAASAMHLQADRPVAGAARRVVGRVGPVGHHRPVDPDGDVGNGSLDAGTQVVPLTAAPRLLPFAI